jgi:hypothetical protein
MNIQLETLNGGRDKIEQKRVHDLKKKLNKKHSPALSEHQSEETLLQTADFDP